jgi:uncharacterized phage-associated protein
MIKAMDVAKYIVSHFSNIATNPIEGDLTNLKLQILLYYVQVLSLKRTQKPLFNEEIEVWDYGIVIHDVYNHYKSFGRKVLDTDEPNLLFTPIEKKFLIDQVIADKGRFTGIALMEMIKQENALKITRDSGAKVISHDLILQDINDKKIIINKLD